MNKKVKKVCLRQVLLVRDILTAESVLLLLTYYSQNLVRLTVESRVLHGKQRRRDSQYREVFARAMKELDESPDIGYTFDPNTQDDESQSQTVTPDPVMLLSYRPTIEKVPKASRTQAARALTDAVKGVTASPNDREAWKKLLQFAPTCFAVPKRGGKGNPSLPAVINQQIASFVEGVERASSSP